MVAARGGSLKDAWDAVREECDPKFADYAIYEHCLPFNVARAFDEAKGIDTPRIWTAERDHGHVEQNVKGRTAEPNGFRQNGQAPWHDISIRRLTIRSRRS